MDFDGFIALIRKDNARYADALKLWCDIVDSGNAEPPVGGEARRAQSDVGGADGCSAPASGTE